MHVTRPRRKRQATNSAEKKKGHDQHPSAVRKKTRGLGSQLGKQTPTSQNTTRSNETSQVFRQWVVFFFVRQFVRHNGGCAPDHNKVERSASDCQSCASASNGFPPYQLCTPASNANLCNSPTTNRAFPSKSMQRNNERHQTDRYSRWQIPEVTVTLRPAPNLKNMAPKPCCVTSIAHGQLDV